HCEKCNKDFEQLLLGSDKPQCPKCQDRNVHRLMSACGFVSKGGAGQPVKMAAGTSGCGTCSSGSCGSCGH
ncbi:MAG: FmdB family zinc ribbon protein, partial [Pseudomonadota bacterium]